MAHLSESLSDTPDWISNLASLESGGAQTERFRSDLIEGYSNGTGKLDTLRWKQLMAVDPGWIQAYRVAGFEFLKAQKVPEARFCLTVALWNNLQDHSVAFYLKRIAEFEGQGELAHIYFRQWDTFRPKSKQERLVGWNGDEQQRKDPEVAQKWVERKTKNAIQKTVYDLLWRQYAVAARESYRIHGGGSSAPSDFESQGFQIQPLDAALTEPLLSVFTDENREEASRSSSYFEFKRSEETLTPMRRLLEKTAPIIREQLKSHFTVCQVIFRQARPDVTTNQFAWHRDGLPADIVKILIFPALPTSDSGTTELIAPNGKRCRVFMNQPGWLLFSPNKLVHRGVAGRGIGRPTIEMTIRPSMETNVALDLPDTAISFPQFPSIISHESGEGFAGAVFAEERNEELVELVEDALSVFVDISSSAFVGSKKTGLK